MLFVSLPAALPTIDVTSALHAAETQRHTVVDGETVFDIAQRYGTTVSAIAAANGLSDPSLILPGAVLSIPSGTSGTTATAPTTSGSTYTVAPATRSRASPRRRAAASRQSRPPMASRLTTSSMSARV
ncbi:LysM peptidoglycan-binding domain-containing protein [Nostocoides jenkinsii]|uniref:LysM peptidoglycan-binding domain-containing protein n=1 Tax=Nostocoides jenkinsii TaxID=330834 RepID=UPI0038995004